MEEKQAEQLYNAVIVTLKRSGMMGLLAAAGDAKECVPFNDASPKTRELFRQLAVNLTAEASKA